jgi:CRP-like cAMP-binding protein
MHQQLTDSIRSKVRVLDEELEGIFHFFIPKKIRKRQFLLNEGDVCYHIAFVEKGLLRAYSIDNDAHEHVVQFAVECSWVSDMGSFLTGEPAIYNIEALEDCELHLLTKPSMDELMDRHPKMERYFRLLMQNNIIALQRRIIGTLSLSAEEKYKRMMELYPNILNRAAQQHIASFLGITPETLSRIRKQVSTRK